MKKFLVTVVLAGVLFSAILIGLLQDTNPNPIDYEEYVVKSGDTLWDIAHLSNGYNEVHIDTIIIDMKNESGVTSDIYPGQVIHIPVYEV